MSAFWPAATWLSWNSLPRLVPQALRHADPISMFRQVIYTTKKDAKQTESSPCAVHECTEPSWWQSRGADPTIKTEDYDPYLDPGRKLPIEVALEDEDFRGRLSALQVSSP